MVDLKRSMEAVWTFSKGASTVCVDAGDMTVTTSGVSFKEIIVLCDTDCGAFSKVFLNECKLFRFVEKGKALVGDFESGIDVIVFNGSTTFSGADLGSSAATCAVSAVLTLAIHL